MDTALRVGGYQFLTPEDAEKARMDARKIEYLQSHTAGMQDANAISAVYQKAIDNKVFTTPVGWSYLYGLRQRMVDAGTPQESITAIPVKIPMNPAALSPASPAGQTVTLQEPVVPNKPKVTPPLIISLVANAILVILVIVMFLVAYLGETNNVLNYKRNLTNQYAAWEEQLTQREAAIREKEAAQGISQ